MNNFKIHHSNDDISNQIQNWNQTISKYMGFELAPHSEFHSDWSSIMKVVETITNNYHRFMVKTDEGQSYCEIWCYEDNLCVREIECFGSTTIEAIYLAVVKFMKWHYRAYDVLSPDGFSITGVETYKSKDEAMKALKSWVKTFERQTYYSSPKYGRIPIGEIESYCHIINVEPILETDEK